MKEVDEFLGSAFSVASTGFKLSPALLKAQRIEVCRSCLDFEPGKRRCRVCGCDVEAKAAFKALSCPKGIW